MTRRENDVSHFFDDSIHIPTRTLFLGTEVDEVMVEYFLKGMDLLSRTDLPIRILMNNVGGDEYHGMAIYDAIALAKCHVTILVYGHAMSMGSWILQAADDRAMAPNATLMLHYGTWASNDHVKYFRVANREMERVNLLMESAYLDRMKQRDPAFPLRRLKKMLDDEIYMPASAAIELGLADRIIE